MIVHQKRSLSLPNFRVGLVKHICASTDFIETILLNVFIKFLNKKKNLPKIFTLQGASLLLGLRKYVTTANKSLWQTRHFDKHDTLTNFLRSTLFKFRILTNFEQKKIIKTFIILRRILKISRYSEKKGSEEFVEVR